MPIPKFTPSNPKNEAIDTWGNQYNKRYNMKHIETKRRARMRELNEANDQYIKDNKALLENMMDMEDAHQELMAKIQEIEDDLEIAHGKIKEHAKKQRKK